MWEEGRREVGKGEGRQCVGGIEGREREEGRGEVGEQLSYLVHVYKF